MTEDEDWLGLSGDLDPSERAPAAAFGHAMRNHELRAFEDMCGASDRSEFAGARTVLFVDQDLGGVDPNQEAQFQSLMGFPRAPSEAEIERFVWARNCALHAAFWSRLRDAVAQDDADEAEQAKRTLLRRRGEGAPVR
ncbi:hypothetical protein [Bradyrhizobium sp. USDA 4508]